MDKATVIKLARQAEGEEQNHGMWRMHVEDLERFAALVAAHEREECAKLCDEMPLLVFPARPSDCAAAIRNRSTHDQNDHS